MRPCVFGVTSAKRVSQEAPDFDFGVNASPEGLIDKFAQFS